VADEKKNQPSWIRQRLGEAERERKERAESSLNGRGLSRGSVIRLRFKSARLETRDARPVVSDNGLLFFRGQMLDQNCRQRRPLCNPCARIGASEQPPELKVSEGGGWRRHVSLRHFINHSPIYPRASSSGRV